MSNSHRVPEPQPEHVSGIVFPGMLPSSKRPGASSGRGLRTTSAISRFRHRTFPLSDSEILLDAPKCSAGGCRRSLLRICKSIHRSLWPLAQACRVRSEFAPQSIRCPGGVRKSSDRFPLDCERRSPLPGRFMPP